MFIGGKVFDKSTIVPCISVLAFRNVNEAIALANNNVQGLSASVWTENVGLANYMAQKLEVSNVWINSFGIYSVDVAFTPKKLSGKGYFGGIQGFQEFLFKKNIKTFIGEKNSMQDGEKILINAITSAKKAYSSWSILPKSKRNQHFDVINQYIDNNRSQFESVRDEWLNQWKTFYRQYIDSHYDFSITSPVQGYTLNISYSGRGVLVAETSNNIEDHNIKLIIASILEGNSLILLNQSEQLQKFYVGLSKELPHGIFNVVPYFKEASRIALQSPEVETYFNEYVIDEDLHEYNKFETVTTIWKDIFNKVTYLKNIWCNIGK
ncbi:hypothetical protein WA026_020947 [Henosepilachna vigintioctopunctata]|uniref:Aldehyde dehydrogenase domain-containing protein n=1 Tax=Henosepilachna vigintioctopunctata TaxID=420089 RepID=A0AAW1VHE2_9CUCU